MKNLRKVLAIVLAMTLMLTFSVGAMAAEKEIAISKNFVDDGIFVTEEMILRDIAAIEAYANEGATIRNMATKSRIPTQKKLGISLMLQDDSRWENTAFPCGHGTYGQYGCAMTSYAMMSKYFGTSSETPVTFTKKYYGTKPNTFDPCVQNPTRGASLMGASFKAGALDDLEIMENTIVAAISNNNPVMVRVDAWDSHYFVAYGYYITSEGSVTIYIRDPEGDVGGTLLSDYCPDNSILSFAIFS